MKKGKGWYGFYATMVIFIITGFIILAPIIKKDKTKNPHSNNDANVTIEFCTEQIDLKINDTLVFDENIIKIESDMDYVDIKFSINFAEETEPLKKDESLNYTFTPTHVGNYDLVATYKNNTSKSTKIKVDESDNTILEYNLGEVFNFTTPNDETIVDWDENLLKQNDEFVGTVAGVCNIYTGKNFEFYRTKVCHKIAIVPKVVLTEGENYFEVVDGAAIVTVKKQMAFYLYINVYKEINSNRFVSPKSIEVKTNDEINCEMFCSPDWEISLLNSNINEVRMVINYYIEGCEDYPFSINIIVKLI